jgi:hypothetical protein
MTDPRPSLSLRCRRREVVRGAPRVDIFGPGARTHEPDADPLVLAVFVGANDDRHVPNLAFRAREARIPPPHSTGVVDLRPWSLAAASSPAPGNQHRLGTVATAMAAAVPLALAPAIAMAQDADTATPEDDEVPALVTPQTAETPRFDLSLPRPGAHRTLDRKLSVATQLTPGDACDCPELPRGTPAVIPGVALSITGGVFMTVGMAVAGIITSGYAFIYPSYMAYYGGQVAPFFVLGGSMLGAGIPLLIVGGALEAEYDDWEEEMEKRRSLSLSGGPTPGGWQGQLSLRF